MSHTPFLWQGGRKIDIEADPAEITMHAADERSARQEAQASGVGISKVRAAGPGLFRAAVTDVEAGMAKLRANHHVVHHVYRGCKDPNTEFLITESFFLKFKSSATPENIRDFLQAEHLTLERQLSPRSFLVRVTDATGMNPVRAANKAAERADVEYAEPNLLRTLQPMFIPVDPLFKQQWHLHAPVNDTDLVAGADIAGPDAWDVVMGTRDIVIAVADDGFDLTHPDLTGPDKITGALNITLTGPSTLTTDDQVQPRGGDYHGTPCAGVALAEHNGVGAVGVAPGCSFLAVRFPLGTMTDDHFVQMFDAISARADVVSCSWGVPPADAPMSTPLAEHIADLAATGGRRGRGLIFCVAAGNSNAPIKALDNTFPYRFIDGSGRVRTHAGPIDRWIAAHPAVLTIGASTSLKRRAAYSSWGRELCVCAPSNNFHDLFEFPVPGRGILTTDNEGAGPDSDFTPGSRFTPDFGGTSSATPTVAGVCGLVLSANPNLGADEVRSILERTADKDMDFTADTPVNGPGEFVDGVSLWFGHGKVNAARAVALAAEGSSQGRRLTLTNRERLAIEDLTTVRSEITAAEDGVLEEIRVKLLIRHTYIGDLRVQLQAPDGTAVMLHNNVGRGADELQKTYTAADVPALRALSGRSVRGTWTLVIRDTAAFDRGELQSWALLLRVR